MNRVELRSQASGRAGHADPLVVRAAKNIVTEIGEATKALSTATTGAISEVPWRALAGMRDRTIHRYPEVDLDVLWDTMEHDLPHVARQIRLHLDTLTSDADHLVDHVGDLGMKRRALVHLARRAVLFAVQPRTPRRRAVGGCGDLHSGV